MNKIITIWSACIIMFLSCQDEGANLSVDSQALIKGLLHLNSNTVKNEINKLTIDLYADNVDRHKENVSLLINRINEQGSRLNAELNCFSCIETLPTQSEILISVDSSGIVVNRIIDILTPENGNLKCLRVH